MSVAVRRLPENPIVGRTTSASVGRNINGPSLIMAPPWLERPLGRYYLYFAHHHGRFIRLATADELQGPWTVYEPGTLQLEQSGFPTEGRLPHIASPDVHVDPVERMLRMYFHGRLSDGTQATRVALSSDGIHFETQPQLLGRPYLRVFRLDEGFWYGLAKPGLVSRSRDGLGGFETGPRVLEHSARHNAVLVHRGELLVFFSRIGDTPERILLSRISLEPDWRSWQSSAAEVVLEPELPWEGAELVLEPSESGWTDTPVRQLRDPAVFQEEDRTYLLYSAAGESGIAIAELNLETAGPPRTVDPLPDATRYVNRPGSQGDLSMPAPRKYDQET